jgi:general secretion pathway protein D
MIVTHTSDVHRQIDELLRALRNQKGTQIHVKCKFLNVLNSELERIGVNWQSFDPTVTSAIPGQGNLQLPGGANPAPGVLYGNQSTNTLLGGSVATTALAGTYNDAVTTGLSTAANGEGLSLSGQTWRVANNFYARAVLEAVQKHKKGNVIYEPDLTMFNGQQAHVVQLNQQSYVADYDVVQFQMDPVVSVLSYGTVLDVVAIASADKKYITLTLRPTNAQPRSWRRFGSAVPNGSFPGGQVSQGGESIGSDNFDFLGGSISENPLLIPEMEYQSVQTSVTIPDGGSLVIAGMTNGFSGREHQGVPFLSHIPFLGRLFSTNARAEGLKRQMIVVQADVVLFEEIESKL